MVSASYSTEAQEKSSYWISLVARSFIQLHHETYIINSLERCKLHRSRQISSRFSKLQDEWNIADQQILRAKLSFIKATNQTWATCTEWDPEKFTTSEGSFLLC